MKSHKSEYATDFPLDACPEEIQQAVNLLSAHFGLPPGPTAVMALTVAFGAIGNCRTFTGDASSPRSASFFSIIEMPANSRTEATMEWLYEPFWTLQASLRAAQISSGQNRIVRAAKGEIEQTPTVAGSGRIAEIFDVLYEEVKTAFPEITIHEVARLPTWRDAVAHSFDHGLFCAADRSQMLSLDRMTSDDRQDLIRWLAEVWRGSDSTGNTFPPQIILLWTADPQTPHSTNHVLYHEGSALPAFVLPWRQEETQKAIPRDLPSNRIWSWWIMGLSARRESPGHTVFSFAPEALDLLTRLRRKLSMEHSGSPDLIERAITTAERLAILLASTENNTPPEPMVAPEHIERASLIACWLLEEHLYWLASVESAERPFAWEIPEDPLKQVLHSHQAITPETLHRVTVDSDKLTPTEIFQMLTNQNGSHIQPTVH